MNIRSTAALLLTLALCPTLVAQQAPKTATVPPAPKSGFRAEFLHDLDELEQKYVSLATAMPQSKYGWRPGEGVRSVSEVYMHVAASNYFLATFLGVKPPADSEAVTEKITKKDAVLAAMRQSFDHLRTIARTKSDAELETKIRMFGADTTERAALMAILNHLHEHLGQSVAYSRINGVVPPWSRNEK